MADKTVSVFLKARVEGFTAGMRKAKASLDDLTKADVPAKAKAFENLADKAAIAGAGIAAGLGLAVKRFADFDKAMSAVQANSGETGATLEQLRQSALDLGADTQFSATEAAEGINEMAKAGVGAKDILGGGLKGALDLAAAGQVDVAFAAETAATAMVQFRLDGSKIPHVADLLTNAANKAQGGVGDLSMALKQGGLVASAMGLSIEETTAGLAAFASAGLIGSDAGTSLKTMLQRLAAPSKEAAATMSELGISAYDSAGNFVGLEGIAGQLKTAMQDLTPAQRDAAMATIFGSDAVRAANVLYQQGAEGIAKWTKEVSEQGAAARQAATLTDNLVGDVERLGGALDSAFIKTGSGANDALRTLTQTATGAIDMVSKIPGPVLLATGAFSAFALLAPKGILLWRKYRIELDTLGLSLDKISAKAPRAGAALNAIGKAGTLAAIGGVAAGLNEWANAAIQATPETERLAKGLQQLADGAKESADFGSLFAKGMGPFRNDMESTSTALDKFAANARAALDPTWWETATGGTSSAVGAFEERVKQLDTALTTMVQGGNIDGAEAAFARLMQAAAAQGVPLDKLKESFPQYAAAIDAAAASSTAATAPTASLATEAEILQQSADDAKEALDNLKAGIDGLATGERGLREAHRQLTEAQNEMKESTTAAWKEGKTAQEVKFGQARATEAYAAQVEDVIKRQMDEGKSTSEITKTYESARKKILENINARGIHGKAAEAEADKIMGTRDEMQNLIDTYGRTPKNVKTNVDANIDPALARIQSLQRALKMIPDERVSVFVDRVERAGRGVSYGVQERAGGGPIWGPGTKTSDSIDIRASRGEFMQKAAAVDKYGLAFMHAVNSLQFPEHLAKGTPGFASGGPIQYSAMRPAPMSAPRVTVTGPGVDYRQLAAELASHLGWLPEAVRDGARAGTAAGMDEVSRTDRRMSRMRG